MEIGKPENFEVEGEASVVSTAWSAWLECFECYADCKGVFNSSGSGEKPKTQRLQRHALLLFVGGPRVREVLKNYNSSVESDSDKIAPDDFDGLVKILNDHFLVRPNKRFMRHVFRQLSQNTGETIAHFVARLRKSTDGCEFYDSNDSIVDQVVSGCYDPLLRKEFLKKGDDLDLSTLLSVAAQHEAVEMQSREMKNGHTPSSSSSPNSSAGVNNVDNNRHGNSGSKPKFGKKYHSQSSKRHGRTGQNSVAKASGSKSVEHCTRCGGKSHDASDAKCPARSQTCNSCKAVGHFAKQCRSRKKVNSVESSADKNVDRYQSAFSCKSWRPTFNHDKLEIIVGGVPLAMLVDSGSESDIISRDTFDHLVSLGLKADVRSSDIKLFPYTSNESLPVYGCFNAELEAGNQRATAEIIIIDDHDRTPLLSRDTAHALKVIKIGYNVGVNTVHSPKGIYGSILDQYEDLFSGVGKFKGPEIKIGIDTNVTPVCQPYNRIPFALRSKVEAKLQHLVDTDIIEPVSKPTRWISPLISVPKSNSDDIRLCVDMRRANQAIIRERHPMPTIEDLLQDMNGSKVFSKLDMKEGFTQFVLHPDSRDITTFSSHVGLYRYKRLFYGCSMAPEKFYAEIHRLIQGIPGVANLADDIIVHGSGRAEHDARLVQVLDRLKSAGLTLNKQKCIFGVDELDFVGHRLSAKGIDPMAAKVEAIVNASEPTSIDELRSFLGLANYCSKFIPDFSSKTEPLRRLKKKGAKENFVLDSDQRTAFNTLKKCLSSSQTLGYFDLKYKTKVVADASPFGLGAILIQDQDDGPRVISYAARSLSDVESRYHQTEREALSLVWACEKFKPYLIGNKFDLVTDHEPLKVIYGPRSKPCARIERWVLRLMPYDFNVVYWPGSKNVADPLSRLSARKVCETAARLTSKAEAYVRFVALNAVPRAMSAREIEKISVDDQELGIIRRCIKTGNFDIPGISKSYKLISGELCVVGNLVLRGNRIVIPSRLRPHVIKLAHDGHVGIVGTKRNLRTKVWWPSIDSDVEQYIKACHECQLVGKPSAPEPVLSTELPKAPWLEVAVDHFGPFGHSSQYLLVVIDYYSRYLECIPVKSTNASTTIKALDEIFQVHGIPQNLKSDSGPAFISDDFRKFCENLGIKHSRGTPKWPQGNGLVENSMKSIKKRLQIAVTTGSHWGTELQKYLFSYRNTPHPATDKSPCELLFGRKLRTKLPMLDYPCHVTDHEVREHDSHYKAKQKAYNDSRRKAAYSDICVGDEVLLKRDQVTSKTDTAFYDEIFTVVGKSGSQVTVQSSDGREYIRNCSHLRPYQRTHEIIQPSFVGAGLEGCTEKGEETITEPRRSTRQRKEPNRYTNTVYSSTDYIDYPQYINMYNEYITNYPYNLYRYNEQSDRTCQRCPVHCCMSGETTPRG